MCAVIKFVLVMYMSVNQDCMNFIALDDAEKKIILFIYLCLKNVYFKTVKVFAPQKSQWIHSYEKKISSCNCCYK